MISVQVDIVRQQQGQALLHPAGDAAVLTAPKQTMVHKHSIRPASHSRLDQRQAGRHARDNALNPLTTFDLQAIGAEILETLGLQQGVKSAQQLDARNTAGSFHRFVHAAVLRRLA